MQMLYNSEAYAVLQFELTVPPSHHPLSKPDAPVCADSGAPPLPVLVRGGFEIIDKAARREIYLEGLLAERFREGAQALVASGVSSVEHYDAFIAGFAGMAQQPLHLH